MNRTHALLLGIGFGLVVPAISSAETAYTRKEVNLRAGPSRDYPTVAEIPPGVPVQVNGCVDDWTWCDVTLGLDRGWIYAGNLEYPYQNRRVVVLENGPIIGFPIVTFSVGPYWDTYYRGRPWYSRRSYWSHRPAPPHWNRPGYRPPGYRPPSVQPIRPDVIRPGDRPGNRPGNRPPVVVRPERPHGGRPEVVRPQPVRPAPVKPSDHRGRPDRERKPGGN
jgi:uncharacterized protein YraI